MNPHDRLIASARVYRLIADPVMANDDGADPWLIGSALDPEVSREHCDRIVAALIVEGHIVERDGRLFPTPYESDGDESASGHKDPLGESAS